MGLCHILSFKTFFPEEYATKEVNWMVLHEDDNKLDFRPHKLRLGTPSENAIDALNNKKRENTKTMRMRCVSYINGVLEKEHDSQSDAMKYLKTIGFDKALHSKIGQALAAYRQGKTITRYGRTWKIV